MDGDRSHLLGDSPIRMGVISIFPGIAPAGSATVPVQMKIVSVRMTEIAVEASMLPFL
ncbi:MAG TPA: hypothetical protein VN493_29395 [Thermoanaerobaculia bacterium]|nr:hypothetical protein [Thermoanaerobaculia bacterium]